MSNPPPKPEPPQKQAPNAPDDKRRPRNGISTWQYLFWILLLIVIPMAGYYSMHGKEKPLELTQFQFEQLLRSHSIVAFQITDPANGSSILSIKGKARIAPDQKSTRNFHTRVLIDPVLQELFRTSGADFSFKAAGSTFTNVLLMMLPTVLLIAFFWFIFSRQMRANGQGVFSFGKSRARRMDPNQDPVTFADVAGCDEAKEDMAEIVDYLRDPAKFSRLGGKIPRGVLLVGPPGTGKTLLAKAIAGEAKVPFFSISGSDFVEMFVGVGASRVRDMFEEGKKNAPCLIFIDEIDAVGRSRFSGIGGGHDEREQTLNAMLVEMDGFEANKGVIVIAATNRPDVLDPALLRPGRFDRQITVDLPDLRGRLAILKIHARKTRLAEDVDLRIVARGTAGFSGADLANIINEAALLATRRNLDAVRMDELEEARDKVHFGKERRSHRLDDKVKRLTAFHESGHALVGIYCEHALPLHKITIIPRGNAMGMTMSLPESDQYMTRRQELLDFIAVCFGGRMAEAIVLDDISTGASQDIRVATDMAKKMVCQWGMSDRLGLVNYSGREEHLFLGRDITRSEDFSQETAREIDLEIRRIIDAQKERAESILRTHLDQLNLLAETLLVKETMTAREVYQLLGLPEPAPTRSAEDLAHDFDDPVEEAIQEQEREEKRQADGTGAPDGDGDGDEKTPPAEKPPQDQP